MKQSDCGFSGRQGAAGSPARPNRTDRGQGGSNGLCVYFQVCVCVREKDEGGECPVKLNVASWLLNELALAVTATLSDLPAGTSLSHLGCQWMAVNPTLPWTLAFNKPIHVFNKGPVRRVHVVTCYLTSASYPGVCDTAQSASWLFRMSGCSFWYRSVDSVFVTECAECYLSPEQTHKLHCCCGSYQCSASSPLPPCIPQTPLDDISLAIQHSALVTTDSLERVIVTVPGFTLHHRNTSTETLPRLFHVFRDLSTSSDIYTLIDNKPSELWFGGDSE